MILAFILLFSLFSASPTIHKVKLSLPTNKLEKMMYHRDVCDTDCPGAFFPNNITKMVNDR